MHYLAEGPETTGLETLSQKNYCNLCLIYSHDLIINRKAFKR